MEEINRGLEEKLVSYIGRALSSAVQHLHDKRIMHRDIKGPNVLINSTGFVKLAGLETSVKLNNIEDFLDEPEGSPHWMAPEAASAVAFQIQYNYKVDIWSLGATILEMAEGHPPHHTKSARKLVGQISVGDPPKLAQPNLFHPSLSALLELCLQRSPQKRTDASQLLQHSFFSEVRGTASDVSELVHKFEAGVLHAEDTTSQPFLKPSKLLFANQEPQVKDDKFGNYVRETRVPHNENLHSGPEGVYKFISTHKADQNQKSNSVSLSQIVRSTFYSSEECNSDKQEPLLSNNFDTSKSENSKFDSHVGVKNSGGISTTDNVTITENLKHSTRVSHSQPSFEKPTAQTLTLNEVKSNTKIRASSNRDVDFKKHSSATAHENLPSSKTYNSISYQPHSKPIEPNLESHRSSSAENSSSITANKVNTYYQPYSSSYSSTGRDYDSSNYSSPSSYTYRPYSASSFQYSSVNEPLTYIPYKGKNQEPSNRSDDFAEDSRTTASKHTESPQPPALTLGTSETPTLPNKNKDPPIVTKASEQIKTGLSVEQPTSSSSIQLKDLPGTQRSPNDDGLSSTQAGSSSESGARNKFNRRRRMGN
ncbi:Protein kinase domain [Trinorchestia longiramus]|nr:Protein kinase domain [Trinorchestia longiramus]